MAARSRLTGALAGLAALAIVGLALVGARGGHPASRPRLLSAVCRLDLSDMRLDEQITAEFGRVIG